MKKQKIKDFKNIYLAHLDELLDNASSFAANKVVLIDNGLFSVAVIKKVKSKYSQILVRKLNAELPDDMDLVLVPCCFNFIHNSTEIICEIEQKLIPGGVLLANYFNVLKSSGDLVGFKQILNAKKLNATLLDIFSFGDSLGVFQDKVISRDDLYYQTNYFEIINVFAQKRAKPLEIKVLID
jgi:SAM-dependent methyltransferase